MNSLLAGERDSFVNEQKNVWLECSNDVGPISTLSYQFEGSWIIYMKTIYCCLATSSSPHRILGYHTGGYEEFYLLG
jgi:hypothetical protein